MRKYRFVLFFLMVNQLISFCNNQDKKAAASKDTVISKITTDTSALEEAVVYEDCNAYFFSQAPKSDSSAFKLKLKNGHSLQWKDFVSEELMSDQVSWGLKDLDADTSVELIVTNYSGGAHCCNELYIFSKDGSQYLLKAKLFGGFECIDPYSNIISYSFNESLGYFFGCYACGFTDSSGSFKVIREISLKYNNGRFHVLPWQAERAQQVTKNLEILSKHKYEDMEEGLMDSGWRKEFAMNFAVWHYNNGKNWKATKTLFDKYYTFKDAPRVWKEFRNTLKEMEKSNDL